VVVSYFHGDGLNLGCDGTVFEALRTNLELFHRDAEAYKQDDPEHASDYDEQLEDLALLREAIGAYALADRPELGDVYLSRYPEPVTPRRPIAPTRSGIGIVVPPDRYQPIPGVDDDTPGRAAIEAVRTAAAAGLPGAALQLGHNLWPRDVTVAAELLDTAYARLGRTTLRDYLGRAKAFRAQCDRDRAR
jgi:hypothetical protein